ncbi:hypothetical protein [Paenibacillus xylanexedens]|uniref:hypothetical protein n=1 Tax=Paenibacillus xylanexedens TaxID=528191 RepID=UPI000F534587|nr:hypothetical protein [Paenibacillus xylanexedens]
MEIKNGDIIGVGLNKYLVVHNMGETVSVLDILRDTHKKVDILDIETTQGQTLKVNPYMIKMVKSDSIIHGDKLANVNETTLNSINELLLKTISK